MNKFNKSVIALSLAGLTLPLITACSDDVLIAPKYLVDTNKAECPICPICPTCSNDIDTNKTESDQSEKPSAKEPARVGDILAPAIMMMLI